MVKYETDGIKKRHFLGRLFRGVIINEKNVKSHFNFTFYHSFFYFILVAF